MATKEVSIKGFVFNQESGTLGVDFAIADAAQANAFIQSLTALASGQAPASRSRGKQPDAVPASNGAASPAQVQLPAGVAALPPPERSVTPPRAAAAPLPAAQAPAPQAAPQAPAADDDFSSGAPAVVGVLDAAAIAELTAFSTFREVMVWCGKRGFITKDKILEVCGAARAAGVPAIGRLPADGMADRVDRALQVFRQSEPQVWGAVQA